MADSPTVSSSSSETRTARWTPPPSAPLPAPRSLPSPVVTAPSRSVGPASRSAVPGDLQPGVPAPIPARCRYCWRPARVLRRPALGTRHKEIGSGPAARSQIASLLDVQQLAPWNPYLEL